MCCINELISALRTLNYNHAVVLLIIFAISLLSSLIIQHSPKKQRHIFLKHNLEKYVFLSERKCKYFEL